MWIISIIALIILLILAYLFFAPFFVEIDSTTGLLRIRLHVLASTTLFMNDRSLILKLKVAWWQKEFDLFAPHEKKNRPVKAVKKKKRRNINISKLLRKTRGVLKSFEVKKCYITFDTGNMPINGILYPFFSLFSQRTGKTVTINFWEENEIILQIKNSMARMLWAYIKS